MPGLQRGATVINFRMREYQKLFYRYGSFGGVGNGAEDIYIYVYLNIHNVIRKSDGVWLDEVSFV